MSKQLLEHDMGSKPNTLTELEIQEPRTTDPEALSLGERGMGGAAMRSVMEIAKTPEEAMLKMEALLEKFDETVEQSRSVLGNRGDLYLGPEWVRYARDTLLPNLVKGRRVTINNGSQGMVAGRLKGLPTITTTERSPLLINIVMTDEQTGEVYEASVTPGQITVLTDQLEISRKPKNKEEDKDGSGSEAKEPIENLAA